MKKVISFLLTIIIILSSFMVASAENESVYSSTASNFISFCQSGNSRFLISRDNYFYMQLASKNKSSVGFQYCIHMCDLLIGSGAEPDKQKYREALINIITVHDLDSANSISEQKKLDNLKGLKDYSMDIMSIATDYISLSSFKNPETQKVKESISTAMSALNVLAENTDNWIEAFSDLETVIQNYAYYDEFLKLIEEKAEDKDLSDAAKDLRTSLTRTMEIKLETYSDVSDENFENYTEYFFTDALFTVAKQVPEYENDETFKSFIDSSGNIVGTVKDSWNLGISIGTLVGNFVAGGENLINRLLEMEAIYNISVILQNELLDNKYANSINTENETDYISRYVTFSEFLLSSRIRGEYCFTSVMSEDAGLLNNFYKSTAEEAKKKYDDKVEALLSVREVLLGMFSVNDDLNTTEYTARDFVDKSLTEIIEIMGGDFEIEFGGEKLVYYTSPTVIMYNDDTLPGFAFYIDEAILDFQEGIDVKEKIRSGNYSGYTFCALLEKAKLTDNINANMNYNDLSTVIGEFDCGGLSGTGHYSYCTDTVGKETVYLFEAEDDLISGYNGGDIKNNWLKEHNPKLFAIIVYPNQGLKTDSAVKTINANDKLTFTGILNSEHYEINSNNKGTVAILTLDTPLKCYLYDGNNYDGKQEYLIESIQVDLSNASNYYDKNITISGDVMMAHTGHHRRDIILMNSVVQ